MPLLRSHLAASAAAGLAVLAAAAARPAAAALLVTEFLPDPTGTDTLREWIEIYNSGPSDVDLTGYKVGDEESEAGGQSEGMYQFPAGATLAAGKVAVVAVDAAGFEGLYGFKPDYETNVDADATVPNLTQYTAWAIGTISLANPGDHALIVGPDDLIVDGANHGNVTKFFTGPALAPNESLERVPAGVDTNAASDFVVRASGQATPGQVTLTPIPEPATAGLATAAAGLLLRRRRGGREGR